MATRSLKNVSFDAMVKYFIQHYNIPTKKDVEKLMTRVDRMEHLLKESAAVGKRRLAYNRKMAQDPACLPETHMKASDQVLNLIKRNKDGIGFSEIKEHTLFGDKKIRNIIFRLNKIGKIKRMERGTYTAV